MTAAFETWLAVSAAPDLMRAELSDAIKGLVILVFILGPVLKKLLAGVGQIRSRSAPGGRPETPGGSVPGAPAPATQRPAPVTWEDLMRGAIPDPPPVPEVEADIDLPDETPHWALPSDDLGAPGTDETLADVPLADIPSEGELERSGGDVGRSDPVWASSGLESPLSDAEDGAVPWQSLADELAGTPVDTPYAQRAHARRRIAQAGGWRRAVVMAEILDAPLAVREQWSHPGPPQAER